MYEALEDFYMFGFNIQNKDEDWNGRLLKRRIKVENESVIICLMEILLSIRDYSV